MEYIGVIRIYGTLLICCISDLVIDMTFYGFFPVTTNEFVKAIVFA